MYKSVNEMYKSAMRCTSQRMRCTSQRMRCTSQKMSLRCTSQCLRCTSHKPICTGHCLMHKSQTCTSHCLRCAGHSKGCNWWGISFALKLYERLWHNAGDERHEQHPELLWEQIRHATNKHIHYETAQLWHRVTNFLISFLLKSTWYGARSSFPIFFKSPIPLDHIKIFLIVCPKWLIEWAPDSDDHYCKYSREVPISVSLSVQNHCSRR